MTGGGAVVVNPHRPIYATRLERERARERRGFLPVAEITRIVARFYGVELDAIMGERRSRRIAHARQIAMYFARELTPLSFPEIARIFRRDHTTVLTACNHVQARVDHNWYGAGVDVPALRDQLAAAAAWSLHLWRPIAREHAALLAYCGALEKQADDESRQARREPPAIARPITEREATARRLELL